MSKQTRVRSAKSGQFARKSKAKTAPVSHVTETYTNPPRPKAKKRRSKRVCAASAESSSWLRWRS